MDMNENEPVTCQMCGMEFGSKQELEEHNRQEHGANEDDEE